MLDTNSKIEVPFMHMVCGGVFCILTELN